MSPLSKVFVLFALAVSASSLATPLAARNAHQHHAMASRKAAPAPAPLQGVGLYGDSVVVKPSRLRRRADGARCRAKPTSSSSSASETPSAQSLAANAGANPTSPAAKSSTPAPAPTPTPEPAPEPTPSPEPTSSTKTTSSSQKASPTTAAEPAASGNTPSFLIGTQTGQGTFYGIGLGACGITNSGDDRIAAVSHLLFDAFPGYNGVNPNTNPICGRSVTAHFQGKSTTVQITDRCEACALTDLDFSPRAFEDIADFALGRISGMTWSWN